MADGAHHYHESERLLEQANDCTEYDEAAGLIAQAQVHATLAVAWAQSATVRTRAALAGGWKP